MRQKRKNKIIIFSLLGLLCIMAVGYAAFNTNLKIKGTSGISSNWDIKITNVTKSNTLGEAEEVKAPTWTDLTAYMEANLYEKGDAIEYDVTVENRGTIDATLDNVTENIKSTNEAVKITFSGYTKGEKLFKNSSQIIKVKIEYNPEFEGTPEEGSGEVSVDLNYTQAEGGTITPTDKYLVTYDCTTNGGQDCTNFNEYKSTGESINLSNTATKEGFKFLGWSTNKDTINATEVLNELNMLNENITLYAIFKDVTPPECELTVSKVTLDKITVKANCTDASGISKYELSDNDGEFVNKNKESEYEINNVYLSKIKVKATDGAGNNKVYILNDEQLNDAYDELTKLLDDRFEKVVERQNKVETDILNKTYPVGSIYITDSNVNPGTSIGGVWESYASGRTLVGVDSNDSNFNTVNKTGGTSTSTLAVTNLPSHTHSIPALSGTAAKGTTAATGGDHTHTVKAYHSQSGYNQTIPTYTHYFLWGKSATYTNTALSDRHMVLGLKTSSDGAHTHSVTTVANTTGNSGNGTSFTNLQPYITVYIWKRVS